MSSLTTSSRGGALWEDRPIRRDRWATSTAVIGLPLTITTTCCARAADHGTGTNAMAATSAAARRIGIGIALGVTGFPTRLDFLLGISAYGADKYGFSRSNLGNLGRRAKWTPGSDMRQTRFQIGRKTGFQVLLDALRSLVAQERRRGVTAGGRIRETVDILREMGGAEGPQADRNQNRMRRRRVGGDPESVVSRVAEAQAEAIVDIANTQGRGVDDLRLKIIQHRPVHVPILRELERSAAGYALAARQQTDVRLGIVVAVDDRGRPPLERHAAFELHPAHIECLLVEAEARDERIGAVGLERHPCDVVGSLLVQAAVDAGVADVGDFVGVLPHELVGLTE